MHTVIMYLLKMLLCSAVLYGYYRVALYNECFHQWNRFYLLTALLLCTVVPLLNIPVIIPADESNVANTLALLPWNSVAKPAQQSMSWQDVVLLTAACISVIAFIRLLAAIVKIIGTYASNPVTPLQNHVQLIVTKLSQAPFSFFNWLFWRHDIDPASANGQRMLAHELTHIREQHSIDKLFTSLLLCVFWMNPFFWLMRRELNMIHEFLADRKAIGSQDGAAFAEMILQALPLQPATYNGLVNPFFTSQIKRRLFMITTSKKPQYSYLRHVSGLIMMICSAAALTLSIQYAEAQKIEKLIIVKEKNAANSDTAASETTYSFKGVSDSNSFFITADTIIIHNRNKYDVVNILRVDEAAKRRISKSDTSNKIEGKVTGINIFEPNAVSANADKQPLYLIDGKEADGVGLKALDPSIIESITVLKDASATALYGERAKHGVIDIKTKAKNELKEVVVQGYQLKKQPTDTSSLKEIEVIGYATKAKKEQTGEVKLRVNGQPITVKEELREIVVDGYATIPKDGQKNEPKEKIVIKGQPIKGALPLYFVDGQAIDADEMKNIKPNDIESINVMKDDRAVKKYGVKAKNGVVEIKLKKPIT